MSKALVINRLVGELSVPPPEVFVVEGKGYKLAEATMPNTGQKLYAMTPDLFYKVMNVLKTFRAERGLKITRVAGPSVRVAYHLPISFPARSDDGYLPDFGPIMHQITLEPLPVE